jgi:phosphoglucosamine mutase
MISASHNSFEDNGIKLFGPDGYKLSDEAEAEIEARVSDDDVAHRAVPAHLGRAKRLDDAEGRYIEFAKNTFPRNLRLDDLKIVVDCANGAAYKVAPTVLWELGADVVSVGVEPDGLNINKGCGSTDCGVMQAAVVSHGADLGIALDGDADRVLMCDETGEMLDGDQIMALVAEFWARTDRLRGGGVVATVMSNLGLERYLENIGLTLERTKVGDRYVVEHMRQHGFNLGGEQSGHIILSDYSTTGDGLIASLQTLAVLAASGRRASEAARVFSPIPQTLQNVTYGNRDPLGETQVKNAIAEAETRLGREGRLVIRKSGTEPVVRVMAEGDDEGLVAEVVSDIVSAMHEAAQW